MKFSLSLLMCMLFILFPVMSLATSVKPSSLDYMTGFSSDIVIGTVENMNSYWENKRIYTDIAIRVTEYLKAGDPNQEIITVKLLGGRVGNKRLEMDGAPVFKVGEKVLLFLVKSGDKFISYGFYYGVCRVRGDYVYGPVFENPQVIDLATQRISDNPLPPGGEDLLTFKMRIQEYLK